MLDVGGTTWTYNTNSEMSTGNIHIESTVRMVNYAWKTYFNANCSNRLSQFLSFYTAKHQWEIYLMEDIPCCVISSIDYQVSARLQTGKDLIIQHKANIYGATANNSVQ